MHETSDATLSAYMDRELDPEQRAEVADEIARNPLLAQRLAALREADALTQEAFATVGEQAAPESLLRMLNDEEETPVRNRLRLPSRWRVAAPVWTLAAGIAAGLALSLVAPWSLLSTGGEPAPARSALQPVAAIATALDTTASSSMYSAGGVTVVPLKTFRSSNGQVCREYQARSGARQSTIAAIACRDDASSGWHNKAVISLQGTGKQGYAPATAQDSLMAMRPQWRQAKVLGKKQEQTLLQQWTTATD